MDRSLSLPGALLCAVFSSQSLAQGEIPECKDVKKTASGLEYCVLKPGREEPGPGPSDWVEVHYTGWLANGKKFDSSREREVFKTRVDQVVKGWGEALQLMTPGAHFKLTIPPELGYGEADRGVVPPNSTMIFEVELLGIARPMPRLKPANEKAQKTTDSGLKYELLQQGTGKRPGEGELVVMRYAMFTDQGRLHMCTEDKGETIRGTRDQMPLPFLKELYSLVRQGDVVRAEVPPKLGGGEQPIGNLAAGSSTTWELEVLDVLRIPAFRPANAAATKTTDSGLKYEVLEEGAGPVPGAEDGVSFRYAMFTTDGKLVTCSEQQDHKFGGKRDQMMFPFLKELFGLMKQGCVVRAEVPPALGPSAQQIRLPAGSTTIWEVELVAVGTAPKLEASAAEKLKSTESGLQYEVIKQGKGRKPRATDSVVAHYTGWLADGTVFDSSYLRCEPTEFSLAQVIRGWTEGVQMMAEGSVYQFVIPPGLAYGVGGKPPAIPQNATLTFRIELVKVK